jgi:hypothetical protein
LAAQTKQPIGIELGEYSGTLCEERRPFDIRDRSPQHALVDALSGTRYSLRKADGIYLIVAPDLTSWQRDTLDYRYDYFPGNRPTTMADLGARLTGWMEMEIGHVPGFAASVLHSPSSQNVEMGNVSRESTEEIADRIVTLDGKGLWIFRGTAAHPTSAADEEITVYSYTDDVASLNKLSCNSIDATRIR